MSSQVSARKSGYLRDSHFSGAPFSTMKRSTFNLSHCHKTTFNAGELIPVLADEILPGDTFDLHMSLFARLSTPIFPVMDNMNLDVHFFFVPNRLLWDNWEKFNGARTNPGDSIDFVIPNVLAPEDGFPEASLYDYFGIPTKVKHLEVNSLFFRAYNFVYNEWYRDENIQDSVPFVTTDADDASNYTVLRRNKRRDYFTSCLPWPQKGAAVGLSLTGNAPISGIGFSTFATAPATTPGGPVYDSTSTPGSPVTYPNVINSSGVASPRPATFRGSPYTDPALGNYAIPDIHADLSKVSAIDINDFRRAFQVQRLLEKDARGGTRYTEMLRAHFGVKTSDSRIQRPEYLGGFSSVLNIHPVAQTSSTDSVTPQANLSSFGTVANSKHGFKRSFEEHGILLAIASVRSEVSYQAGLHKKFTRRTRYDFYLPVLAHLGEQAVLNQEIHASSDSSQNDLVFGYQERWAEYRYRPSLVTGLFRSNAVSTLDAWHLAQNFTSMPLLNPAFLIDDPPMDRVLAVKNEPHFIFDSYFSIKATRVMPVYSVPGYVDHF